MEQIKKIEIKTHTDNQFGIFQIELEKTKITEAEQEINLMIDKSGSMDEMCGDGSSKMHQIRHVAKNILRFIAKKCTKGNVAVSVKAFNTEVETIFDKTVITEDTVDELVKKVDKVYPNDGTDIGVALKSMHSSGLNRHNIFMSDGDANIGETCPTILAESVDPNANNTFVGFGLEHNPEIFAALSKTKGSAYYFVDKAEKSGNAYGEILDGILYNCLKEVRIQIVGGTLYNWKTNEWTTEIFVGNMSGEAKKTFHIMTPKIEDVKITVHAINLVGEVVIYGTESKTEDLQNMIYRQRTLELLFKATQKMNKDEIQSLKKELKTFLAEMKEYMKKETTADPLMKNLCDDIVITYRTLGTQFGAMYSSSRQTTQGDERVHNVSDTPTNDELKLSFSPRFGFNQRIPITPRNKPFKSYTLEELAEPKTLNFESDDEDLMDSHIVSAATPYYSGRVATVMRSVTEEFVDDEEDSI